MPHISYNYYALLSRTRYLLHPSNSHLMIELDHPPRNKLDISQMNHLVDLLGFYTHNSGMCILSPSLTSSLYAYDGCQVTGKRSGARLKEHICRVLCVTGNRSMWRLLVIGNKTDIQTHYFLLPLTFTFLFLSISAKWLNCLYLYNHFKYIFLL